MVAPEPQRRRRQCKSSTDSQLYEELEKAITLSTARDAFA
jgi:hypothetical protein